MGQNLERKGEKLVVSLNENKKSKHDEKGKLEHKPVMKNEVLEYLEPQQGEIFLDCTIGNGGHAIELLKRISPQGHLIGIDQDEEALLLAHEYLNKYEDNITLIKENFQNIPQVLEELEIKKVNGALFDLGVSSIQLRNPERGFSFKYDGPLDMRMDRNKKISAYDLVNNLSKSELSNLIKKFGEERWHKSIAEAIVKSRKEAPITTTKQLADLIKYTVPHKYRYGRIHPATRTFQAFRIAVNRELLSLKKGLNKIVEFLDKKARVGVISFHSLEDRIVKRNFKKFSENKMLKVISKKPLTPSEKEKNENPRSRSAKFRIAQKL